MLPWLEGHHSARDRQERGTASLRHAIPSSLSAMTVMLSTLLLLLPCVVQPALAQGATNANNIPQIDYEALGGSLGIVGSFAGIELYDPSGKSGFIASTSSNNSTSTHGHLLSLDSRGTPSIIASVQGDISAVVQCGSNNGVYFGGSFSSINTNIAASNIAVYFPANDSITSLDSGLDGAVHALACDGDTLYVGGSFRQPLGAPSTDAYLGAAAAWNTQTFTWSPLGFGGFKGINADILSIAINNAASPDKSVLFGGSFNTYWLNETVTTSTSVSVTPLDNGTLSITESNTTAGSTSGSEVVNIYPSLGSSLIPIALTTAEVTSSASSSDSRYSDPANVLCPAGQDGSRGSTWLARQGDQTSRITARLFAPLDVGGFRLGNTQVNGGGAQTFRITALPNNEVLTLQYRQDPTSPGSPLATCSDSCPLSHNSVVEYEDFIISASSNNGTSLMTGFEITILSHYGPVAGLHIVQMLSRGTVAYAIDTQNNGYGQGVCASGPASVYGRSSSTHQSAAQAIWDHVEVVSSSLSGTSEGALCAAVLADADANTAPTATWYPYIGQDGTYDLQFFTPACSFDATCGQRGAVDVEVTIASTSGSTTTTTTINQEVDYDLSTLIYSGTINPISGNAQVRVTLKLSSSERPTLAPGKGDKYYLVADKVITVAKDTSGNGSNQIRIGTGMNSVNVTTSTDTQRRLDYVVGHGLFEWKVSDTNTISPTLDSSLSTAQQIPSIQSASAIDRLALNLASSATVEEIVSLSNSAGFILAGTFSTSASSGNIQNILMVNHDGSIGQRSAQRGLNGPVSSLELDGDYIYAAGNFSATADGTVNDLHGRARRQIDGDWEALPGLSSASEASHIGQLPGEKLLVGYANNAASFWYPSNASLTTDYKPLIIGNITSSYLSTDNDVTYLTGSFSALLQASSSGSGKVTKDGLEPVNFGFQISSPATASGQTSSRRSLISTSMISSLRNRLRKRQSGNTLPAPTTLPANDLASSQDPVIVAGAHWYNATSNEDISILGGRFVSQGGAVTNVGILHSDGSLAPLHSGDTATGDVTSLLVTDDLLWIGRASSESGALSVYDLAAQEWRTSEVLPSPAVSGSETQPSVNAMIAMDDSVIIAGYFDNINGITGCSGVCEWQRESRQWIAYENGIEGVAAAAGLSKAYLYLAGTFIFNNTSAYVMAWEYESKSWTSLSTVEIPGPAWSITVDTDDSIFITGLSAVDSTSYLLRWNGSEWSPVAGQTGAPGQGSLEVANSNIHQIFMAPTLSGTDSSYFSASNRVLMVTGQLNLASSGQASTAIFDGFSWYPYILSTTSSGAAGTVAGFFYPASMIQFGRRHHLAIGLVILVSMAIALGVVFLGVLIALIITLSKRHDDSSSYPPVVIPPYDADYAAREATSPIPFLAGSHDKSKGKVTPTPMLETINAATAALLAGHPGVMAAGGVRTVEQDDDHHPSSADEQNDGTSSEDNSIYDDPEEGDDSLPMRAVRYSFDAEREEELSINTRDMVEVLDESDEHWHIVRRLRDGRQGLVPSAFLT